MEVRHEEINGRWEETLVLDEYELHNIIAGLPHWFNGQMITRVELIQVEKDMEVQEWIVEWQVRINSLLQHMRDLDSLYHQQLDYTCGG